MVTPSLAALLLAFVAPPSQLPFTIDVTENVSANFPGAPQVESASFGQWKGRWVFIGGRIAGYHGVGSSATDFPRADANREVWVVDTTVKPAKTYHVPVAQLAAKFDCLKDEWVSTGQLSYQDGQSLYIAGGYGKDSNGKWITFPIVSKVNLPILIDSVMKGQLPAEGISFASSELVQSAGGELIKLPDGNFYLVMGHVFTGTYSAFEGQGEHNAAAVSQTYLNEIRKLTITGGERDSLAVKLVARFRDEAEFHRRDLNVAMSMSPKGAGLAIYGGVFTPETQLSYGKPVYLGSGGGSPVVDSSFEQKMNAYNCAKLLLYDAVDGSMYTTFFGGISRYAWDAAEKKFLENPRTGKNDGNYLDGLQWSDQISTVRRNTETSEFVQSTDLPGFIGTDAIFIPADGLARASAETEILDLKPMKGKKTFVGYIYGGIRAYPYRFPYNKTAQSYNAGTVPTKPSEMILKVYLQALR